MLSSCLHRNILLHLVCHHMNCNHTLGFRTGLNLVLLLQHCSYLHLHLYSLLLLLLVLHMHFPTHYKQLLRNLLLGLRMYLRKYILLHLVCHHMTANVHTKLFRTRRKLEPLHLHCSSSAVDTIHPVYVCCCFLTCGSAVLNTVRCTKVCFKC